MKKGGVGCGRRDWSKSNNRVIDITSWLDPSRLPRRSGSADNAHACIPILDTMLVSF